MYDPKEKPARAVRCTIPAAIAFIIISICLLYGILGGSSEAVPRKVSNVFVTGERRLGAHVDFEEDALTVTHFKCYQSSEYAEICVYDLLCFDGDKVRTPLFSCVAFPSTGCVC